MSKDIIICPKCRHSFPIRFTNGDVVEYCENCGEKLRETCPYCANDIEPEPYHELWLRCNACKFPILRCSVCGVVNPIESTTCENCGETMNTRPAVFFPGLVNAANTNVYYSARASWLLKVPTGDIPFNKTSAPLVVNNLLYFWSLQTRNREQWILHCFDVMEGGDRMAGRNVEIVCPHTESPQIILHGRCLLTTTANRLWVHDAYDGAVKVPHWPVAMPFMAYIYGNNHLIVQKYDKRNELQFVSMFPHLNMTNEQVVYHADTTVPCQSDPVPAVVLGDALYMAGFDGGLLCFRWDESEGRYTCEKVSVLRDRYLCQLLVANDKLYFTYMETKDNALYWGTYTDGIVSIRDNIALYHPFIARYCDGVRDGIVYCREDGAGAASLVFNDLLGRDDEYFPAGAFAHNLVNIAQLNCFTIIASDAGLYCLYTMQQAPPKRVFRTAFIESDRTEVKYIGKPFLDADGNYFVCVANYAILFVNVNGRTELISNTIYS